jgi:hypothetical protein
LRQEQSPLTCFSKDLFVEATECRGLTRFWLERGWIGDVSNLAYSECKGVGDFCGELGGFGFRGAYSLVFNVRGVSRVVGWPSVNADVFLITRRDF